MTTTDQSNEIAKPLKYPNIHAHESDNTSSSTGTTWADNSSYHVWANPVQLILFLYFRVDVYCLEGPMVKS